MQNRECIIFGRTRDIEQRIQDPCACVFVSPVLIPSPTNRRVDSFATYAYSCRTCPLEFFVVFGFKNNKKLQITVILDISKQIEQHTHILGKIFARWHRPSIFSSKSVIFLSRSPRSPMFSKRTKRKIKQRLCTGLFALQTI